MQEGRCRRIVPLIVLELTRISCRLNPDLTQTIPGFTVQGRPTPPEILSTKVVLTPPVIGGQRGAVWSTRVNDLQSWIADVEFRCSGPERGSGKLGIWVARDGAHKVGDESVYTVGKFEGLAVLIDHQGGQAGTLRAFLNDGTKIFHSQNNVDSHAFGHCNFSYRNLGKPSQVKLRHTPWMFRVEIDGNLCFESDKVHIPTGYNVGVTAVSADMPDSFEVYKLVVLKEDGHSQPGPAQQKPLGSSGDAKAATKGSGGMFGGQNPGDVNDPFDNQIIDVDADHILTSVAQFADLHNRIQSMNHHMTSIYRQVTSQAMVDEKRHEEFSTMIGDIKGLLKKLDGIDILSRKIEDLERTLKSDIKDLNARLRESENSVKYHVNDQNVNLASHLAEHITSTTPGHSRLIFVIVASQVLLAIAYISYKRRKSSPKKFL